MYLVKYLPPYWQNIINDFYNAELVSLEIVVKNVRFYKHV